MRSLFGAIPESGGVRGNFATNAGLGLLGIRPVYSDTILALVRSQGDLERAKADAIATQRYLLQQGRTNEPVFAELTRAIAEIDLIIVDVNAVAVQEGVTPPKAIDILRQRLNAPNQLLLRSLNEANAVVP